MLSVVVKHRGVRRLGAILGTARLVRRSKRDLQARKNPEKSAKCTAMILPIGEPGIFASIAHAERITDASHGVDKPELLQ
jgi:hypothetical protein